MNEAMRAHAAKLRRMASSEAADWLLEHYPNGGEGIILLDHISLSKSDNHRLARYYLAGPTAASARPYEVFAKRLGLRKLIGILEEVEIRSARDSDLLAYHLRPLITGAQDEEERRVGSSFLASLKL